MDINHAYPYGTCVKKSLKGKLRKGAMHNLLEPAKADDDDDDEVIVLADVTQLHAFWPGESLSLDVKKADTNTSSSATWKNDSYIMYTRHQPEPPLDAETRTPRCNGAC